MKKYDLVVIGAGPSGYAAAMRALDFKKSVLLVDREGVGGAGIKNGALSSKTWWEISKDTARLRRHLKQLNVTPPVVEFRKIKAEVDAAVRSRRQLLTEHMELLKRTPFSDLLDFKIGNARLLDRHEVEIVGNDGTEKVCAAFVLLATGSRPRKLPDIPIDEKTILTSDGIEHMEHFPKSMVILGAGVIGCEYATIFSGFGRTKVHLIDKSDRILPFEDEDVVAVIEKNMEDDGVYIHRNSSLVNMEIADGRVRYELEYTSGHKEVFYVEKALISVGRVPNYEHLWPEAMPIKLDRRGVKDYETQTSVANVYAAGDITSDIALVNVGELEGRHAVEKMFGNPKRQLVYENISTIMFLHPEVAGVGLNENQAKAGGVAYKVVTLDYACIPRAIAKRNTQGFIKLLVTDDDDMKILGMRVVGHHASSAIQAVALLISMDKGIEELAECVHPHPSVTEGIQECVRMLMGKSLFKPGTLTSKITCRSYSNGVYKNIIFPA